MSQRLSNDKPNYNKRFLIGLALNFTVVVLQVGYGIESNSVALISDGLHNCVDIFTIVIAWAAYYIAFSKATTQFTYGFKSATILAAFTNTLLLFAAIGIIAWEAIHRFSKTAPIDARTVIIISAITVVLNAFTAYLFFHTQHDGNLKSVFMHMVSDALISLGVILATLIGMFTHWSWVDPSMSLLICFFIISSSWGLLKSSIALIFQGAPRHIAVAQIKASLLALPEVIGLHDLHVWGLSTQETALSVHLVVHDNTDSQLLAKIHALLASQFAIEHATIQIEVQQALPACQLSCN